MVQKVYLPYLWSLAMRVPSISSKCFIMVVGSFFGGGGGVVLFLLITNHQSAV